MDEKPDTEACKTQERVTEEMSKTGATTEENSEETEAGKAPQSADVVSILQSSVKALEASVGSAFSKMGQSLQQSVSMMESMNGMMEEYVTRGLRIKAKVQPGSQGKAHLVRVNILNTSRIPLLNLCVKLTTSNGKNGSEDNHNHSDESEQNCQEKSIEALGSEKNLNVFFDDLDLITGTEVLIRVEFPSPGTGKILGANRSVVVKAREVDTFVFSEDALPLEQACSKLETVGPLSVREALGISPLGALITNKGIYIAPALHLGVRVEGPLEDGSVDVYLFNMNSDLDDTLSSTFAMELELHDSEE